MRGTLEALFAKVAGDSCIAEQFISALPDRSAAKGGDPYAAIGMTQTTAQGSRLRQSSLFSTRATRIASLGMLAEEPCEADADKSVVLASHRRPLGMLAQEPGEADAVRRGRREASMSEGRALCDPSYAACRPRRRHRVPNAPAQHAQGRPRLECRSPAYGRRPRQEMPERRLLSA